MAIQDCSQVDTLKRQLLNSQGYWEIPEGLDTTHFDFTWKPFIYERPYIHQFGTQHQKSGGPKFVVPENQGVKYQDEQHAIKLPDTNSRCWRPLLPNATIDFSWHPDETEPPFIYVFGNQWYDSEIMPTYQYKVKGATEKKYVNDFKATLLPLEDDRCWRQLVPNAIIDKSWVPHPFDPPYIYVFGNQWYDAETMPTFQYRVKGATEKKYINDIKATLLANKDNWIIPKNIDDSNFDYSWCPNPFEPPMNWQFGTQWQKTGGPKYKVENALATKFVDFQKVIKLNDRENRCWRTMKSNIDFDFSWHPDETEPPFIYVFGNQWYDAEIMPTVVYRVKDATEKKYINSIKTTLLPIKEHWQIPDDIADNFDYSWCPSPKEPLMNYQFGTQWQKTGGPKYIVNGANQTKYIDILKAQKLPNLRNWRVIEQIEHDTFDFSWHPDDTDGEYNYIFGNKFHSPENMPTIMFKNKNATANKYYKDITANLKINTVNYSDSIFDTAISDKLETKYTFIGNIELDFKNVVSDDSVPHIHIIDNVAAIVPDNFKSSVYDKLYDFPYIKYHKLGYKNELLDIVFLTNGEIGAEQNYLYLVEIAKKYGSKIHIIDNVKGRVKSQHEAAKIANSPWYFLVNAKCKVNIDFDFSWQPDFMKKSRHYIFTATNNMNGLEYGHMAIVANNKKLTLETTGEGLDFTLEKPHEVININSGIGIFNTSEWDTWRTSFREVLKLKYYLEIAKDSNTEDRLKTWLTVANGDFSKFALKGASDAISYYETSNGAFDKLKLSYDWQWLKDYFDQKYT
jgi:hypothetical protein